MNVTHTFRGAVATGGWAARLTRLGIASLAVVALLALAGCQGSSAAPEEANASSVDQTAHTAAHSATPAEGVQPTLNIPAVPVGRHGTPSLQGPAPGKDATPPDTANQPGKAKMQSAVATVTVPDKKQSLTDDEMRKRFVGRWRQIKDEKRTITINEDGTAGILAEEISDYRQYFVGKTLKFDIQWTIEDGLLTLVTTGGEPKAAIKYVMATMGDRRAYRINSIDDKKIELQKPNEKKPEPNWNRLADE